MVWEGWKGLATHDIYGDASINLPDDFFVPTNFRTRPIVIWESELPRCLPCQYTFWCSLWELKALREPTAASPPYSPPLYEKHLRRINLGMRPADRLEHPPLPAHASPWTCCRLAMASFRYNRIRRRLSLCTCSRASRGWYAFRCTAFH